MQTGLKGLLARFLPQKKPLVLDTSSPLLLPHEGKRECGACTACCKWLGVTGFSDGYTKEPGQECRHVGDSGCSIYADRPQDCRAFVCSFLGGMFPDEAYRPDRLRIVFHLEEVQDGTILEALVASQTPVTSHAVSAYLFWKDVHKQKRQARVIEAFLDAGLCVCLFHTEGGATHRRLLLPTQRDRYITIRSERSPFSSLS